MLAEHKRWKPREIAVAFACGGRQNCFDVLRRQIVLGNVLDDPLRIVFIIPNNAGVKHPINWVFSIDY